jgi:hypothetical protein
MQAVYSSTHAIEATASLWRSMVDLVRNAKPEYGRGCLYFERNTDSFDYLTLFELQEAGAEKLGIDPDIFRQLLNLIGSGYDFKTEFVLLVKTTFESEIKFVVQTGELSYEGWRGVKSPEEIRQQERADQLAVARQLRAILAGKRKSKKKGKR